jgi:hypothetical protein
MPKIAEAFVEIPKIAEAFVEIGARMEPLRKGLQRAQSAVARAMRKIMSVVGRAMKRLVKALVNPFDLLRAFLALQLVKAMGRFVTSVSDTAFEVHALSLRLGASVEALQEYRLVAAAAGVDFRTFAMALQRMTRRVAEAAIGTGEAQDALKELNLDVMALSKLKPDEQFDVIADRLSKVASESARVRLAFKLFDSEGVALVQVINQGTDAISKLRDEAHHLGMVMSKDDIANANKFRIALIKLKGALSGIKEALILPLLEGMAALFRQMAENAVKLQPIMRALIGEMKRFFGFAATFDEFGRKLFPALKGGDFIDRLWAGVKIGFLKFWMFVRENVDKLLTEIEIRLMEMAHRMAPGLIEKPDAAKIRGDRARAFAYGPGYELTRAIQDIIRRVNARPFEGGVGAPRTDRGVPSVGFWKQVMAGQAGALVSVIQTTLGGFRVGQKNRQEYLAERQLRTQENMDRTLLDIANKVGGSVFS